MVLKIEYSIFLLKKKKSSVYKLFTICTISKSYEKIVLHGLEV